MGSNYTAPIFVLGTQRSGTTLLARMLSSHSSIFIQNEISVEKVFRQNPKKEVILTRIDEQIRKRHGLSLQELLQKKNKVMWGIKDPELTDYISCLHQFSNESKFVIIVRDGRGVVNSYMENKWGLGTNAYSGAIRWKEEVLAQKRFMMEHPEHTILIRFEDLIADMECQLKKICQHLEVEFEEKMLEYNKQKADFKENRQNVNTNRRPDIKLTKKWQQKLSKSEINIIESVAGDELVANNYELIGQSIQISAIQKFYFNLHQKVFGEIQQQYKWRSFLIKSKLKKMGFL